MEKASKFKKYPGWVPVGSLVIPYSHSLAGGISPEAALERFGIPNVTVRTNVDNPKYARMATKTYNFFHKKPLLTRMPFIPTACASPEMREINRLCMVGAVLSRLKLGESEPAKAYAHEIMGIMNAKGESKGPIMIIEGEKKALALQAAVDNQIETALYHSLKNFKIKGIKSYSIAEKAAEEMVNAEIVGVSGVWQTERGCTDLHGSFAACVDFSGRDVCVCYDRDIAENSQIAHALGRLNLGLKRAGAKSVSAASPELPAYLANIPREECKGFDDTVEAVYGRTYAGSDYERYLMAHAVSFRALCDSFVPLRQDYSMHELDGAVMRGSCDIFAMFGAAGTAELVM